MACLSHASSSSCFQLFRSYDRLTRPLRSSPITSLLRCYGSVRPSAPRRDSRLAVVRRLSFSLGIGATGSCSSAQKPASDSRPLFAGRRLPSHQAHGRLVPGSTHVPGFDDDLHLRRVFEGFTFVRLSDAHLLKVRLELSSNAHHRGSLPQQLGVVWDLLLKTDPEGPALIFHAAYPHGWSVQIELLSVCVCSTLRAMATIAMRRVRPCRFPTRSRNQH